MGSIKSVMIVGAMLLGTGAEAAWVSGGGKIRKDEQNPWWLYNTTRVTWCVDVDENAFSVAKLDAELDVAEALRYWQTELTLADDRQHRDDHPPVEQLKVATQDFVRLEICDGTEDLTVYLGKATRAFRDYLGRLGEVPSGYIGMAVRTEYDPVQLRGKGFVYIAPDRRESPDFPVSHRMIPDVWSAMERANFQGALQHELGHVFGMPHENELYDAFGYLNLMAEDYPEHAAQGDDTVVRRQFPRLIEWGPSSAYASCWEGAGIALHRYLGVGEDIVCFKVPRAGPKRLIGIQADGSEAVLATIETPTGEDIRYSSKITAWMPPGQRVMRRPSDGTYFENERLYLESSEAVGSYLFKITPTRDPAQARYGHAKVSTECLQLHIEDPNGPPTGSGIWYPLATNPHPGKDIGNCGRG